MKKKILRTLAMTLCIAMLVSVGAFAYSWFGDGPKTWNDYDLNLGTHVVGIDRYYGGTTYGYAWVDTTNNAKVLHTDVWVNSAHKWGDGIGYAQTQQASAPGNYGVQESHSGY